MGGVSLSARPLETTPTPPVGARRQPRPQRPGAEIGLTGNFIVQTPNSPGDVSSVVLVKPGSTTHAFDMEQRIVGLTFTQNSGALTVNFPPDPNTAPPGYYMLFLLNNAGVPSLATFVQVTATPGDQPPQGNDYLAGRSRECHREPGGHLRSDHGSPCDNVFLVFSGGEPNHEHDKSSRREFLIHRNIRGLTDGGR